jgi:hypothetical protein
MTDMGAEPSARRAGPLPSWAPHLSISLRSGYRKFAAVAVRGPLVPFVRGVMRSLVSGDAETRATSPVTQARSLYNAEGALAVDVADRSRSVEEAIITEGEREHIQRDLWEICSKDDSAALILMGMLDGRDGEDLWLGTGLAKTEYETNRRWVVGSVPTVVGARGRGPMICCFLALAGPSSVRNGSQRTQQHLQQGEHERPGACGDVGEPFESDRNCPQTKQPIV